MSILGELIARSLLNRFDFFRAMLGVKLECIQKHKYVSPTPTVYIFHMVSPMLYLCFPNILTLYEALHVQQMLPMIFASCAVWCPSR